MSPIHRTLSEGTGNPNSWSRTAILVCVVALLSFLNAKLGGALVLRPQMLWPLWPGNAFLLAVLLVVPRRTWPILIAAGLAGFFLCDLQAGLSVRSAIFANLADVTEVLVAVFGISYAFGGHLRLNSIKSLTKYLAFAVIPAAIAGAFSATQVFHGSYWIRWRISFFTEALALLTLTPALLIWVSNARALVRKSLALYVEGATLVTGLAILGYIAFVDPVRSSLPVLLYSLLPFLLWSALRFGMLGTCTSMVIVAFLSIWGAVHGRGPFTGEEPLGNMMSLQLFLFVAAATFMVLAVLVEEQKRTERQRRETEAALKKSEEKFSKAFQQSPMALSLSTTKDDRYIEVNTTFESMTGWRREEVIGRTPFDLGLWVDPSERETLVRQVMVDGSLRNVEAAFRMRDGCLRTALITAEAIELNGETCMIGVGVDITERKRAEDALRNSEERFNKVFRSSPLAVSISTEAEGRYLDVNQAFLQMLGYQRGEVIGHTGAELGFWAAHPSQREEVLRQLKEDGPVQGLQTQFTTANGDVREAEVSAELVELDGQRCLLAITRDITETRQLQEQLLQAQKMEAVGRLAGGVAHDFNNLLGVIIGHSDLALRLITPESRLNRHLQQIKKASNRAVLLTRQLLAFSRRQVVFPRALDLNEVVVSVTGMLRRVMREDISISFQPTTPLGSIHADPSQIEQVLMNLVVNARDAMPAGGEIRIGTAHAELDEHFVARHPGLHSGQHVVLAVSDTGCGIDDSTKAQIFEPFFTTKGGGEGTGLGLSTVYGIVKQSGGCIFLDSERGKGTRVEIYFPMVAAQAEHVVEREEAEFPGGCETILVVEDDEAFRHLTVNTLRDAGYRVVEAENAEAALDLVKAGDPRIDVLVTDIVMPGRNGIDLLKQARTVHPSLRSLFMSGYAHDLIHQPGELVPEAGFLEKPFTRSLLLRKVRMALRVGNANGRQEAVILQRVAAERVAD
jgi:PAS domain S-box-containing protein